MIDTAPYLFGFLFDIGTSEQEGCGDDMIHRQQKYSVYYRLGQEKDKEE